MEPTVSQLCFPGLIYPLERRDLDSLTDLREDITDPAPLAPIKVEILERPLIDDDIPGD